MSPSHIHVCIVDDSRDFREYIHSLLENVSDITVIGEAENGAIALQMADELHPEVIMMDPIMPEMDGIEATTRLLKHHPEIQIIAISMYRDKFLVKRLLNAGVKGYLMKDCDSAELQQAIRTVAQHKQYFTESINPLVTELRLHGV